MLCTFFSECSLVLLSSSDNVCQGALHAANVIMSTDIVQVFPIINIQHYKLELLDLFKTILHQKGLRKLQTIYMCSARMPNLCLDT